MKLKLWGRASSLSIEEQRQLLAYCEHALLSARLALEGDANPKGVERARRMVREAVAHFGWSDVTPTSLAELAQQIEDESDLRLKVREGCRHGAGQPMSVSAASIVQSLTKNERKYLRRMGRDQSIAKTYAHRFCDFGLALLVGGELKLTPLGFAALSALKDDQP